MVHAMCRVMYSFRSFFNQPNVLFHSCSCHANPLNKHFYGKMKNTVYKGGKKSYKIYYKNHIRHSLDILQAGVEHLVTM